MQVKIESDNEVLLSVHLTTLLISFLNDHFKKSHNHKIRDNARWITVTKKNVNNESIIITENLENGF